MSKYVKISSLVTLGVGPVIGEFVIIGELSNKGKNPELKTAIGNNAIIRSHTVIYEGNSIGDDFQTGHGVLIREENEIGNNVSIGSGSVVEHHTCISDNVRLHSNVFIPEHTRLEAGCWLGPNVVLTNAKYPLSPTAKETLKGPRIKKGAKVGANCTILPGIIIGENALVGAGSVVSINIPDNAVAVGNPAKIINDISNLPY